MCEECRWQVAWTKVLIADSRRLVEESRRLRGEAAMIRQWRALHLKADSPGGDVASRPRSDSGGEAAGPGN